MVKKKSLQVACLCFHHSLAKGLDSARKTLLETVKVIGSKCCNEFIPQQQSNAGFEGRGSDVTAFGDPLSAVSSQQLID